MGLTLSFFIRFENIDVYVSTQGLTILGMIIFNAYNVLHGDQQKNKYSMLLSKALEIQ
jgi:hypothetical protein